MSIEVVVPNLTEAVADATSVTWHKKAGDTILKDENVVDLETEKVVLEVPARADGVLAEIFEPEGATVLSGQLIAKIEEGAVSSAEPEPTAKEATAELPAEKNTRTTPTLSPTQTKMVAEHNLDTSQIQATGKGGRITKTDILKYLQTDTTANATPSQAPTAPLWIFVANIKIHF